MSIGDILVHLDGGPRDAATTAAAAGLARHFSSRLTGLFARVESFGPSLVAGRGSEAFQTAAHAAEAAFAAATAGLPTRFWRLSHGETTHVLAETTVCARVADLVVVGQDHPDKPAPSDLVEHLLTQSGRPCLIVPARGEYALPGGMVMMAWNGGREAARALHDAMPFLETAPEVEVVTIRRDTDAGHDGALPPVSILDHLAVHGAKVTRETLAAPDIGVMDLLLSRACDQGASLLVMGAFGGHHLPFLGGSGTRYMLEHLTLPVLMSR